MKPNNCFMANMLDMELPDASKDVFWRACRPTAAKAVDGDVILTVPFQAFRTEKPGIRVKPNEATPRKSYALRVRAYGDEIIRLSIAFTGELPADDSEMLELHSSIKHTPLAVETTETGWDIQDETGKIRMRVNTAEPSIRKWAEFATPAYEDLDAIVFPDGDTAVPFMPYDQFDPPHIDSASLAFVERHGVSHRSAFAFHARQDERFAGTGERFAKMDLSGRTLMLENTDGQGVNNRRCYKNIPFYVSSRPYGLLVLSSAYMRLSLADVSTRAAQGLVEESVVDLFMVGGRSVERIVFNYRRLTGFPRNVPLWSYGTWMSRMSYFSEEEVRTVGQKMRDGGFPCDVLHLDTGWFAKDWVCEWEFSKDRFPDPARFMKDMKEQGFRVSLWQTPNIGEGNKLLDLAKEKRYLAPCRKSEASGASDFSDQQFSGAIDFSNPEAVQWYQMLLENLLRMGTVAIKTDFGEDIAMDADYHSMPARLLHNLYGLLYQKAAWEVTNRIDGEGIIWARAGWTGCQRYPVHWSGDSASTWDGLAGSIRGGLHLGVSGFAFWSHDVPGFHGVPHFMNTWPEDDLYVRWTQAGVFTSHLRYHGTSPREPYEYPNIADIVRKWLRLRYCLIPYLVDQGDKATKTGYPVLRAMIFHHEDDPYCWQIDDQYYFGDAFLIAPIMNSENRRDIYLPEGSWTDLWTGKIFQGPRLLKDVEYPLEHMPVFAKTDTIIRVYPQTVQCTDEMDLSKSVELVFDSSYQGLTKSILGQVTGL